MYPCDNKVAALILYIRAPWRYFSSGAPWWLLWDTAGFDLNSYVFAQKWRPILLKTQHEMDDNE